MQRWYVRQNGKAFGPIAPGQLKELVRSGKIAPDSSVRLGDEGKWVRAVKVKGLLLAAVIFIPVSALIGIFFLYFFGLLYRVVGRMLGGEGDGPGIRTAFAWSVLVPMIAGLPIDILYFASNTIMPPTLYVPLWVFNFPILVLNIWGLIIQIAGLSVAHHFSIIRAIGTVLLSLLIIFLVLFFTLMLGANLVMLSYS